MFSFRYLQHGSPTGRLFNSRETIQDAKCGYVRPTNTNLRWRIHIRWNFTIFNKSTIRFTIVSIRWKKSFHSLSTFYQSKWIFSSKVTPLDYIFIKRMRTILFIQVAEISIGIIQFFCISGKLRTSQPFVRCYSDYYSPFHLQHSVTRIAVKDETKLNLDSALLFIFIKI